MLAVKTANTVLYCQEWAATVAFYRDALELPITYENAWFVEFALTDSARISLANAGRTTLNAVEGQGITLAWQVDAIESTRAWLGQRGIVVGPLQTRFGSAVCYFYDPEGHRLELWQVQLEKPHGLAS